MLNLYLWHLEMESGLFLSVGDFVLKLLLHFFWRAECVGLGGGG